MHAEDVTRLGLSGLRLKRLIRRRRRRRRPEISESDDERMSGPQVSTVLEECQLNGAPFAGRRPIGLVVKPVTLKLKS